MSLLQTLKTTSLQLRKERSKYAPVLTTIYSDVSMIGKNTGKDATDAQCIDLIKKYVSNLDDTISKLKGVGRDCTEQTLERDYLSSLLPQQMTDTELSDLIATIAIETNTIGGIMSALNNNHAGLFDKRRASEIAKTILGG